uniref:Uncharacterized protein n=1 Tax=Populus trichocarpa TaxID=3694 RepID=A0A2K1YTL2_POPTR
MVLHNNEEIMELMVFNHDHPKIIKHITSFNPTPRGKKDKKEEGYLLSHRVELNHQPHRSQEYQRFMKREGSGSRDSYAFMSCWGDKNCEIGLLSLRDRHGSMMVAGYWCSGNKGGSLLEFIFI